jgi:uncharacterized membrane protein
MPNDLLREEVEPIRRAALAYIAAGRPDARQCNGHLRALKNCEGRLSTELEDRGKRYLDELDADEAARIDASREEIEQSSGYERDSEAQKAALQGFENLRHVNGGRFPWNVSPVLYVIPLLMLGVVEWYVNFSTFSTMFIPVFAISATVIVAAVFAGASHLHGAYLKQISEIIDPSVDYRNVLGRKIVVVIVTVLLVAAFATVVWLRWLVIAEQLGIGIGTAGGTFGGASSSMIWSKVGPTVVINFLIWGLGTLYSWALQEKVPDLRESYREYLRASRAVDRRLRPFHAEEKRLNAYYVREREKNKIAVGEYTTLLENVRSTIDRLQQEKSA